MEIGTISNIYLLIFLPLFASLLCQIFQVKNICFLISLFTVVVLLGLVLKIFPDILIYEKIKNDYELSLLSITLEFSLDLVGVIFLFLIIFLEFLVLIFYRSDIEGALNKRNQANFYSVFLLNLFSLIGILTSNNLFNLYLFIEIHTFAFFAIATISYNSKLLNISFKNFCLSSVASILILICFFAIFLTFGELNFDKIVDNLFLLPSNKIWFLFVILILFSLALIVKFFPLWQYFEKIKSTSLVASFLVIDAFFIKILIGLFLTLKFIYFFFGNNFLFTKYEFSPIMILIGFSLVIYASIKLLKEHHLKLICAFFSISNIGFMISAIGMQSIESMQSLFFFLLNFAFVNFFIFIFASHAKKHYQSSSIDKIFRVTRSNYFSEIPLKLIVIFIAGLPLTFLFFGYWYIALASMDYSLRIIMIVALIFSNYAQLNIAMKIIDSIIEKEQPKNMQENFSLKKSVDYLQIVSFWILIVAIYTSALLSEATNNMALRFASFLLANTI
jgi:multicomponent Na+:H+ antiporter subunit D